MGESDVIATSFCPESRPCPKDRSLVEECVMKWLKGNPQLWKLPATKLSFAAIEFFEVEKSRLDEFDFRAAATHHATMAADDDIRFDPWDRQPTADRGWGTFRFCKVLTPVVSLLPLFLDSCSFCCSSLTITSVPSCDPESQIQSAKATHLSLGFLHFGHYFYPCTIVGLPPGNGLIVTDEYGVRSEVVTYMEEQRWSGIGQPCLMFVALACFTVIVGSHGAVCLDSFFIWVWLLCTRKRDLGC